MKYQEILAEKVIGNLAIGYHRTKTRNAVNKIVTSGFEKGNGDTYGPGVYMTYDIKSQMNTRMITNYGDFIIRNKVVLNDYLIFDKDVARMVHKNDWQIEKQLKRFGFLHDQIKIITSGLGFTVIGQSYNIEDEKYTSDYAHRVPQFKNKNIAGMVFTGRQDGKVIVTYKLSTLTPFGVAEAPDTYSELVWEKISATAMVDEPDIDYEKLHGRISDKRRPYKRLGDLAKEQSDLQRVLDNYKAIKWINKPTEKMFLAVIKTDPEYLDQEFGERFCNAFSEEFKLKAVALNGSAIQIFDDPSEQVQLAAINNDPWAIRYIKHPTEKVQLLAISKHPLTARQIKNLTDKAYELFVYKKLAAQGFELKEKNGEWEVYHKGKLDWKTDDLSEIEKFYYGIL